MRGLFAAVVMLAGCSGEKLVVPEGDFCALAADAGTPHLHAHNDYEHARPLLDALAQRFDSVEADLWLHDGELVVSHAAFIAKGTLRELYLDPLQARVDATGSVYGDGAPFVLWLDVKDGSAPLREALRALLSRYPMLTTFDESGVHPGAVTAVLTGDGASKQAFVEAGGSRPACRDGEWTASDPSADTRWRYYALAWSDAFSWDGSGPLPDDERHRLECLVGDMHRKGRPVRFYAAPDNAAYWAVARAVGVDFINTDDLAGLRSFLDSQ